MRNDILQKISDELHGGIDTQAKCLYLLAEIRKFLDQCSKTEKERYPDLYFFCNWVLHSEMDRTPAKDILIRFERLFAATKTLKEKGKIFKQSEKHFYQLSNFRSQLRNFLGKYVPSQAFIDNSSSWSKFRGLLVKILIDCPLVNNSGIVSKFVFIAGSNDQITMKVYVRSIRERYFKVIVKEKVKLKSHLK